MKADGGFQTGSANPGLELVQILGQIVVDRVTEAAWDGLRDELMKLIHCDDANTHFPAVCTALKTARLQDLVALPKTLLEAAESDLVGWALELMNLDPKLASAIGQFDKLLPSAFGEARPTWKTGGFSLFSESVVRRVRKTIAQKAQQLLTCPTSPPLPQPIEPQQAIWMVAECLVQTPGSNLKESLDKCDTNAPALQCPDADNDDTTRMRFFSYLRQTLTAKNVQQNAGGAVQFSLESAKLWLLANGYKNTDDTYLAVDALEQMILGMLEPDWVRITTSAVTLLQHLLAGKADVPRRLLDALAAIGQYAATFDSSQSPADQQKARRAALEAFIKSQTNRANRRAGAVFSLGGSFGLGGAYRQSFDGKTAGGVAPVLLPMGVAMQTYPDVSMKFPVGLHVQISIIDLGQYVSFEGGQGHVGTPNGADLVAPSVTLGVWGWKREVPFFVAAHGGFAPFVRSDGNPTWFVGGMIGAYVPFFDFN